MSEGPVATVDLRAISANLERVRRRLRPATAVLAAVKANAYGHGAVPVARHLERGGVDWFGVATPSEALELRAGGVGGNILVFSPVYGRLPELVEADVTLTIASRASFDALMAADLPRPARVHLKVDTGMARLGAEPTEALELAVAIARRTDMHLEGIWTHFACADDPSDPANAAQLEAFERFQETVERRGIRPELAHAANSAAALTLPTAGFDMVRPGIALYGYHAAPALDRHEPGLRPALTLRAPVTHVKRIAAGTPVSYGHAWRAPRDTTLATVRCGYADGYPRLLSNRGSARLGSTTAPVAGRVCMDQLLLDAGDHEVAVGDLVVLFGPNGPTAHDLAGATGTVPYEILTSIAPRVAREYVQE